MICEPCKIEFFSPGTWSTLRSGKKFDILHWTCEEQNDCTVCSTVWKDTIATLSECLIKSEAVTDGQGARNWSKGGEDLASAVCQSGEAYWSFILHSRSFFSRTYFRGWNCILCHHFEILTLHHVTYSAQERQTTRTSRLQH